MIEGSGSISLTKGSVSRRPKNIRIRPAIPFQNRVLHINGTIDRCKLKMRNKFFQQGENYRIQVRLQNENYDTGTKFSFPRTDNSVVIPESGSFFGPARPE
jgi:hypothetical protein